VIKHIARLVNAAALHQSLFPKNHAHGFTQSFGAIEHDEHFALALQPTRYEVAKYSFPTGEMQSPIIEKTGKLRVMQGNRVSTLPDPTGHWQYSLYRGGLDGAFIHTLSLDMDYGTAWCVDLPGGGTLDEVKQPLAELTRGVLAVPVQRGGERRIVPVGGRRLLLPELRLRPDIGTHRARGVVVGVALGDPP